MSLATWGKDQGDGDIVLPIVEYDDLDRTTAHPRGPDAGEGARSSGSSQTRPAPGKRPAWDPGPRTQWGAAHGWRVGHPHGDGGGAAGGGVPYSGPAGGPGDPGGSALDGRFQ